DGPLREWPGGHILHLLRRPGQLRHRLCHNHRRHEQGGEGCRNSNRAAAHATGTILTAHFLKSVCLEMGSVASSVTLLINWLASNHGTKISPGGMRFRPRVSTRERISPRRDMMRTSAP